MRPDTKLRYCKSWSKISKWLIWFRGDRCEECFRFSEKRNPLTVHHIDGRPENNTNGNLIVLCAACHLRIQNTGRSISKFMRPYQPDLFG